MQSRCSQPIELPQVEAGQDVQHHESGDALAVGRAFEDIMVPVACPDRLDISAVVLGEVLETMDPAMAFQVPDDVLRNRALVESAASVLGDEAQRPGELHLSVE